MSPKEKLMRRPGSLGCHPVRRRTLAAAGGPAGRGSLAVVLSFVLPAPEELAGRQASDRAQQRHRHRTPPLVRSEGALGGPVGVRFQPRAPGSPGPAG